MQGNGNSNLRTGFWIHFMQNPHQTPRRTMKRVSLCRQKPWRQDLCSRSWSNNAWQWEHTHQKLKQSSEIPPNIFRTTTVTLSLRWDWTKPSSIRCRSVLRAAACLEGDSSRRGSHSEALISNFCQHSPNWMIATPMHSDCVRSTSSWGYRYASERIE